MRLLSTLGLCLLGSVLSACGGGGGAGGGSPRVSAPAAGTFWSGSRVVQWTTFSSGGNVSIEVSDDGGLSYGASIVVSTADDGSYAWNTAGHSDGAEYRVRVRKIATGEVLVSGEFTLDNTAPVAVLTTPDGGELWGGSRDILWTTTDANPDHVDLVVSANGGASYDIPVGVAAQDDGVYTWDTSSESDGASYRINLIATDKAGNRSDEVFSAANFELDNTAPTVSLTSPLGGEDWDLMRTITWITNDANPSEVDLSISTDGGANFDLEVGSDLADTGAHSWSTGYAPDGTQMRMRVIATDGAGNTSAPSVSLADFMITNLRLVDPISYLDVNVNAVIDAGDELYLLFDKDMDVNSAGTGDLELPVVGDTFGGGATVAQGPELHSVVVTLGTNPTLRTRGAFDAGAISALRPGGLDISVAMAPNAIEDSLTGRDAAASGPKDLSPGFVALPALAGGSGATTRGVTGDLDGDGDQDLVVATSDATANQRFAGDGAGGWTLAQALGTDDTRDVALADLDGDGDLDLVLAIQGANQVWINDGAGNLSDSGQRLGAAASRAVVLFDADRDGDWDAAFGNTNSQANTVWWNDGSGTFSASGLALGAASTVALCAGDLDQDGDVDLVAGNAGDHSRVWLNDGAGGFSAGDTVTLTDVRDLALADLNGDGALDVFFAVVGQNEVVLGAGDGTFGATWDYLGNNDHRAVCLGDLDGDGDVDAVTAKYLDAERFWINDGTGQFSPDPRRGEPDNATDVLCVSLDGDGDVDLVVINDAHTHRTYLSSFAGGQPNAAWEDTGVDYGPYRSIRAVDGDVNGDGRADVVVHDATGGVHVLLGDGAGGLTSFSAFGAFMGDGGQLFDADRDGDLDYLQSTTALFPDVLWVNDGLGNFSAHAQALPGEVFYVGDLDGDGDGDLVEDDGSQLELWANDGAGWFSATGQTASASGLESLASVDLDRDGDLDLIYGRGSDTQIWRNDGAGNLSLAITLTPGGTTGASTAVDYDHDGDLDLIFATSLGLSVIRNDGGMSFTSRGITGPAGTFTQLAALDHNEDGIPDYLLIDESASAYYVVTGDGTESMPAAPANALADVTWGLLVDLDGDIDLDVYWCRDDALTPAVVADRVDLFD
ncbi:MAG: VCBS repeat-containing protein [Planctomycetota bacterium]|nr:VCBS repeat-containing protein [Planctomycetota bacterium]